MSEESFAAGLVGVVLDERYRLDALLGEGGMGAVYRATHLAMDRKVAVKLLKPHLTTDDNALQRFAREARSTMKVDSVHAVKVLDFGVTPHRDYYMVLEYLDGRTVQRELDVDGPFEPARVVHIAKQACKALGAAHKSGLIHRDIKPDNLLLMRVGSDPDYVKVLDFGVAKLMDGAAKSSKSMMAITQAGMVFGTPEFMSPEQACGQSLDGRSDLYSLAATMFAMLTGCGMYRAQSAIEWLTHHARTPAPHLVDGAPSLAQYKELDAVLQKCFSKHREQRPQTAQEMIKLLESVEHTVKKGGAKLPAVRNSFSSSKFIDTLDPNATLVPEEASGLRPQASGVSAETLKPSDGMQGLTTPPGTTSPRFQNAQTTSGGVPTASTGVTPAVPSKRGVWLVLGALLVAGVIAAAIVVAMTKKKRSDETQAVAKQTEQRADAMVVASAQLDASTDVDAGIDGAIDASVELGSAEHGSGERTSSDPPDARGLRPEARAVAKLIAEAEAAQKTNQRLRQVMKADAALRADPRNTRARFLLADGLIASGDLERGCKYLREMGKNPTARARANQAGCPTD